MRTFFNIPQKYKAALILLLIVTTVVATSYWGKSTVTKINDSFSSIYKDRLIPANELFHMTDLMYQKRLLITEFLESPVNNEYISKNISEINLQIDSILHEYDKTYLVEEEEKSLSAFKAKMDSYNHKESEILKAYELKTGEYEDTLLPLFNDIRTELFTLSQIQTTVGKNLMNGSKQMQVSTSFIHYCQLGILMILLLIVQSIIFSAKSIIPKKPQKFRLN